MHHVRISPRWKIVKCRTIREDAHSAPSRAPVTLLSSATAFLANDALMSGNDAQRVYAHPGQHHSEISPRRLFRPFCLVARKQDRKIGVAHLVIFCYLLSITAFCAPTALHLIFIPPTGQYALKNFRLFSYFPNPVALLKSGKAASLSRSILAL